ncbi:MAG: response regulator transcription factor [Thermodesulfobacteriota bacterium]
MAQILIIQDSPSINAMLKFRLEAEGFFVKTVESGEEGIEEIRSHRYQLILLDYHLPGIQGDEVCEILKKESPHIPIVFISAQDEEKLEDLTRKSGAEGYIGLPMEGNEMVRKIKGFLK